MKDDSTGIVLVGGVLLSALAATIFYVATRCHEGDVRETTCPTGQTITTHTCENGVLVPTGAACPDCVDGELRFPSTCLDGSTVYAEICDDGAWIPSDQSCTPKPTLTAFGPTEYYLSLGPYEFGFDIKDATGAPMANATPVYTQVNRNGVWTTKLARAADANGHFSINMQPSVFSGYATVIWRVEWTDPSDGTMYEDTITTTVYP